MSVVNFPLPEVELVSSGHLGCQGCGGALAMRYVLKALNRKSMVVIPACCWSVVAGSFPHSALKVSLLHTAFETAAVTAAGVRAALDIKGDSETTVMAWAGDGGTFDIGLQALSGAAERNDDILYVCYDNEAYMNTGIQRSSATPWGAWTTTTPTWKPEQKKDIMAIVAAHAVPYAATASIAYPDDVVEKTRKAGRVRGFKFIHLLAPCPPGWKMSSELTVRLARLAVQTRVFPLYEVKDGKLYHLTHNPTPRPVEAYLKLQGRFSHLRQQDHARIQAKVDDRWEDLLRRTEQS